MSRAITKTIDGERLRLELNRRNLDMQYVSVELGHNSDYINGIIKSGKMTEATAKMLELMYNIRLKDIMAPIGEFEIPEQIPGQLKFGDPAPLNYARLQDAIYEAVLSALRDAWKEAADGTES